MTDRRSCTGIIVVAGDAVVYRKRGAEVVEVVTLSLPAGSVQLTAVDVDAGHTSRGIRHIVGGIAHLLAVTEEPVGTRRVVRCVDDDVVEFVAAIVGAGEPVVQRRRRPVETATGTCYGITNAKLVYTELEPVAEEPVAAALVGVDERTGVKQAEILRAPVRVNAVAVDQAFDAPSERVATERGRPGTRETRRALGIVRTWVAHARSALASLADDRITIDTRVGYGITLLLPVAERVVVTIGVAFTLDALQEDLTAHLRQRTLNGVAGLAIVRGQVARFRAVAEDPV